MEKPNFLEDCDGNKSSKRLFGCISLGCGIALKVALGVYGFFNIAPNVESISEVSTTLLLAGSGLLGAGLLEKLNKKS